MQTNILNMANYASQMDLIYRLEVALAGDQIGVLQFIKKDIANKVTPTIGIIQMVKDMIRDNRQVMIDTLGVQLVCRFEAFEKPDKNVIA